MPRFPKEAAKDWLERAYAVAFAQHLFYQPRIATVARQETDPVVSSGAMGRNPVVRAAGECSDL